MKLTIREDSKNYVCTVIKLPAMQPVQGLDNLVKVTVFGNDCLIGKDSNPDILYLFFPAESQLSDDFLASNNLYRNSSKNNDESKKGFFEDTGRVKSIKFKGIISTGFVIPISTLPNDLHMAKGIGTILAPGDEFTDINDYNVCKKYVIKHIHATAGQSKESRHNKKLKKFDGLVQNQFRFHVDTSHLAKKLHMFQPEDIIVITDKWHGTSALFSFILINEELKWWKKVIIKLLPSWVNRRLDFTFYDQIYSSRSVVKNRYINKGATLGYYNEDIWTVVNEELGGKLEPGITLYGEIVGYTPSGRAIQKGYDYGCDPGYPSDPRTRPEHKFLVYRITYTKPNGEVIEYSWQQIKEYCKKYSIEHVKELYFGKLPNLAAHLGSSFAGENIQETLLQVLQDKYLEKDCSHCRNKVPAEGIVVRRDGLQSYSAYKLKSSRFLLGESKALDNGDTNIEDEEEA